MGLRNIFGRKEKEPDYDPTNISLLDMKAGWVLDYDMKSWEVVGQFEYDWGNNFFSDEYKIQSSNVVLYLHLEEDDELEISLAHKIRLNQVSENIPNSFKNSNEDPPRSLTFEGSTFQLEEESLGSYRDVRSDNWSDFISWNYEHPDGKQFLTLERWGEEEFELSHGQYVESYEFSNILPAS
ncbi:MAG TPA: DUF4178 domain-containing protein [Cytophagales bacterium]|nr:DUF4178 domain-containing protein [Cytophagales bacterium]HAA17587.1 DUF4178 domain-containing protein [Cytophagales bacterium]HAP62516.1 DUF4178 domain-containing protein [Cytophagales bacterium]